MKKRLFALLLVICMTLTLLPVTVSAADGPKDTVPQYDQLVDLYHRTSDFTITDSRSYYFYSSVPDKLRDQWSWKWKIQIKGSSAAPHVFIDGLNIEVSPSSKTPAIEVHGKATAYLYFIGKDSTLRGANGRAAIQKNRSEGQVHVLARTGTTVTCIGGEKAAGIGGSYATRNIFDGLYNGDMYGHGVNLHFGSQSNPDYWGGTIVASGGTGGAGIGGGRGGSGEKLYFYSGTIQANGGRWASGIGGSYEGRGSEIHISGGTVGAQGGEGGAGIGGGCWKTEQSMDSVNAAHHISISGGTVNASGGYNGAGIGGGQFVPAHDITITGGVVNAHGVYGAGIGGGRWTHGRNITATDAQLKLTTGRFQSGSDAAAMGYGDLVYKPEDLVKDPSTGTNDAIKVGSYEGKLVLLRAEASGLTTSGRFGSFRNIVDMLIPNENGRIDVQLLTLPYVQNYGWAISKLEMIMVETSCEGNHKFGWVDSNGCHIWACRRCTARDPLMKGPAENGKHTPGDWEGQEKKCTVCGHVTTKDTTPPVIEGLVDGWDYTADDNDDGTPGALTFTVSDPAGEKETSSGVRSVTVNGVEQTGPVYQLAAPDGGNDDEGLVYEVVASDNAGNTTTVKVRLYRRHRVLFVEDRNDWSKKFAEVGAPHGFDLDLPFNLPEEAYFVDLDNEEIVIRRENGTFYFGIINSNRTFLLVIPKTELPSLAIQFMNQTFRGYYADAADEVYYANPVSRTETGYLMSIWVPSDETSFYFSTAERYTLEQLRALDEDGSLPWMEYSPESFHFFGPSYEQYRGEWYVYAKASNELGTAYASSPRIVIDGESPVARVYPSGEELAGKVLESSYFDGTTYWGSLRFTVEDDLPVTVKDGSTVLEPDEAGVYTIPADMADNIYHRIYIEDACGNKTSYLRNKVRCNILTWSENPSDLHLPHGAVLADELPAAASARTTASGMQNVQLPVLWELPETYDPAARQEQQFTVTGTLDLSGTGITVHPEQPQWQTVQVQVTVAGAPQYRVTAGSTENGTVTAANAAQTAEDGTPLFFEGDWVMLSVVPEAGYLLRSLTVVREDGESVACEGEDDTWSFTQPGANVTVHAAFENMQAEKPAIRVTGEYIYNGTEQTASVEGYDSRTMEIAGHTGTDAGRYTVEVTPRIGQWADGSTGAVTAEWRIEKAEQAAPTGLTGIAPSVRGGSDGKITGADAAMEYRAPAETAYTACTGSEIGNLTAGSWFVRYAEDRNHLASPDAEIVVGEGAAPADCTVTFRANGGTGSMDAVTAAEGSSYVLPACGFTPPAQMRFRGWALSSGGSVLTGTTIQVTASITLYAIWEPIPVREFTITFDGSGGTPTTASMTTTGHRLAALPGASRSGSYRFDGWYTEKDGGTRVTTDTLFTADTTVYARWTCTGGSSPASGSYIIRAAAAAGGSVSPDGNVSVRAGSNQTFVFTPDRGYAVAGVRVDGRLIGAVRSYTFENVRSAHTIEVSFAKTAAFGDVAAGSYYEDAVSWAVENGITTGTDGTHFSPDGICTRAQAVTFLWRAAGSPEPERRVMPFTDVPADSYYYEAVLWAVETGITRGTTDTTFSPGLNCSRAQIVTFLWRAGKSPAAGTANPFADIPADSYYYEAVLWAVKEGITRGTGDTAFSPDADCTRAQIVTFLRRSKKS